MIEINKEQTSLDLIRGLAALLVLLGHTRSDMFAPFTDLSNKNIYSFLFYGITRLGHEAVIVFFILSGFLVGGGIIRDIKMNKFNIYTYAIKRATRIFVPLIPACIFTAFIHRYISSEWPEITVVMSNMFGLNGIITKTLKYNGALWSISYEIWFYIAGGLFALSIITKNHNITIILFIIISYVFYNLKPVYLAMWIAGALTMAYGDMWKNKIYAIIGIFVMITLIALDKLGFIQREISEIIISISFCMILPYATSNTINKHLNKIRYFSIWLSSFSYTLYLFHYPISKLLSRNNNIFYVLDERSIYIYIENITINIIICYILYFAFERNTYFLRSYVFKYFYKEQKRVRS